MFFKRNKKKSPLISAMIVAAGSGTRMGGNIPKQFMNVYDKSLLAYTIEKFCLCDRIDEIILVTREDCISLCHKICRNNGFDKVKTIVAGGATRQQSVYNGLKVLSESTDYVLIHDGARPLIDTDTICKCVDSVIENDACAVGVKVKDTIKYSSDGKYIDKTLDRNLVWQIQTPQAFKRDLITECHQKACKEGFEATDDCMIMEHYGHRISLVEGKYENIKITSPVDMYLMQGLVSNEI